MKKTNDFFGQLNNVMMKQNLAYDPKVLPSYLLSLWLSHDESLLDIVNYINDFQFLLDDKIIQKYYYYMVPKGRRYLKWVKKDGVEEKEKDMCREFGISRLEFRRFREVIKTIDG